MQVTASELSRIAVALLCCAATGCAAQHKAGEAELVELVTWLPGWYDNRDQTDAERAAGRTVHEAVTLSAVPVYAPLLSNTVFYLHENASADARRVLSQRLAAFSVSRDGRIIERTYTLVDAARWREGARNPDLFKSLVRDDLQEETGCALIWRKSESRFYARSDPATCKSSAIGSGALLSVRTSMELTSTTLDVDRHVIDARGEQTAGPPADYHFRRLAQTPFY